MTCGPLPGQDHVAHITWKRRARDGKVSPTAFILRDGEESLSAYWLEKHGAGEIEGNIERVRARLGGGLYALDPDHRFVLLNVSEVESSLSDLSVEHDPTSDDDSHAAVKGYANDDDNVRNELALIASRHPIFLAVP